MRSKVKINYIRDFELCDRSHFDILKGICILAALASYICRVYLKFTLLCPVEGIAAAMFLFCSGYGVADSFAKKRGLIHFWENRAFKTWLPSLVVLLLTSLIIDGNMLSWIADSPLALKGGLLYLYFGSYAVFWLLFYLVESKVARVIGLYVAAVIALFFVPNTHLNTVVLCFPTGVLFAQYGLKYKVRAMKMPVKTVLCFVSLAVAAAGWVIGVMTEIPYFETFIWSVAYMFGALFLLVGVYTAKKLPIFGVFVPFGYMSYGLYLLHDSVLRLLEIAPDWQSVLLVMVVLLALAAAFSWLRERLIRLNKDIRRRKSPHMKGSMW